MCLLSRQNSHSELVPLGAKYKRAPDVKSNATSTRYLMALKHHTIIMYTVHYRAVATTPLPHPYQCRQQHYEA